MGLRAQLLENRPRIREAIYHNHVGLRPLKELIRGADLLDGALEP